MLSLLLTAALAVADIPFTEKMNFARLVATRLAMHFAHGVKPGGPRPIKLGQLQGRVLVEVDDQLLMIGKPRTMLAARLRPSARLLARSPALKLIVFPPRGDLQGWIDQTAKTWTERPEEIWREPTGVAPADLLEQDAFSNWDEMSRKELKRLKLVTYTDILYGDVANLPDAYRERAEREMTVLGFANRPSGDDLASLNDFLRRKLCGEIL